MALFSRKPRTPAHPAVPVAVQSPAAAAGEARLVEIGTQLLSAARGHKAGLLSAAFYSDALMNWSMKDPNFKVQLFRFVDCFPTLRTPEQVFEVLEDYLSQPGVTVPGPIAAALKLGNVAKGLAAGQISKQITGMASKFIAGTDAASALPNLKKYWDDGICFSVDLLGEACLSDEEADAYQRKYLDLINNLPATVAGWKPNPRLETDAWGSIPRTNVSIKISSLSARCDPIDTEGSIRDLERRLMPILEAARDKGVFVNFDMEQFQLKDLTLDLFMRCCEKMGAGKRGANGRTFHAGLAMQAYLKSGDADARRICEWAKRTGHVVTVRLVKGAYWDYHVIHSEQMGWPCPVWPTKPETDACFERMAEIYLDHAPTLPAQSGSPSPPPAPSGRGSEGGVKLALGSHNVRSIAAALAGVERRGMPHSALELQMLHGMADQLKYAAIEWGGSGLRMREYVPVGEMIPGMAYLVRRLLENTSNESWLKAGFADNADIARLLASPHSPSQREGAGGRANLERGGTANGTHESAQPDDRLAAAPERHKLSPAIEGVSNSRPFYTEPMRDFSQREQREAFAAAVSKAQVPKVASDRTPQQAAEMVARAHDAFAAWRDTDPKLRADVLVRAAAIMRTRRNELSAIMIKEAGKTWREADADTCEAIDFCEYYARLAVPMFTRQRLGAFLGELDEQWYQPRGVAVVISPWNFPLAICCGMTVAALVTGNTVIVKPAEQTAGIAKVMTEILHQAIGESLPRSPHHLITPSSVLAFCPAPGETTGAALVRDPRVALVAFTGSRDVGCDILNAAAPPTPFGPQRDQYNAFASHPEAHVKRVICEMGGKNAIIIDSTADLDEAVLGIRHSAFGFQGQKCSACSRLIIVDPQGTGGEQYKLVVHRLVEATKALVIGDPARPGTDVGPVIDAEAQQKVNGFIDRARAAKLEVMQLPLPAGLSGTFVPPTIVLGVTPEHELAREEVFGPVLAIMTAPTYDAALNLANALPYKLTGGVFSRKPTHIERAKREFRVGNLYLNRGITGALVGRQPFGGFGMSGVGSKAGGSDYLLQFVESRASCENTMRRGFAPEL
ncbi:MAG: proline dehydrogenase family protein [Phycisphaeraceae bacterium]|nr:proline dehydrogenase family protein [Phycisphaeraceae bacterium]